MSSTNSDQQDQPSSQRIGKKLLPSPDQTTEAQSKPLQPMKNTTAVNTSTTAIDEYQDEEYPPLVGKPKRMVSEQEHARSVAKGNPSLAKKLWGILVSILDSPSTELERHSKRPHRSSDGGQSPDELQAEGRGGAQISKGKAELLAELKQGFNQVMEEKEAEWRTKERELQSQVMHMQDQNQRLNDYIQEIQDELEHRTRILEAKFHEAKSEKKKIEAEYTLFVRQKQEEEFNRMESARWLPADGNEVIGHLDTLKRDIRTLAKRISKNDVSTFQQLNDAESMALMNELAKVCVLENNTIPEALTFSKSPVLLLNALLAHHIYTTLFKNPFFFLGTKFEDAPPHSGMDKLLKSIYQCMQQANQEEAHIWRSQTLRLLLPPLESATIQETDLHQWTNELISKVANQQAANFLEGPAQYLIRQEAEADTNSKFQSIYQTAAGISYTMWMRRTTMRCHTLKNLTQRGFNPESKQLIAHSSVRYDEFEDQLNGRPISLIVHPILMVYGTNDAKDYDRGSVWVPGEVWLDSRRPNQ